MSSDCDDRRICSSMTCASTPEGVRDSSTRGWPMDQADPTPARATLGDETKDVINGGGSFGSALGLARCCSPGSGCCPRSKLHIHIRKTDASRLGLRALFQ